MENYQGRTYSLRIGADSRAHTADEFETQLYCAIRAREEAGGAECADYGEEIEDRATMCEIEVDGKSWAESVRLERAQIAQCESGADVHEVRLFRKERERALAGVR